MCTASDFRKSGQRFSKREKPDKGEKIVTYYQGEGIDDPKGKREPGIGTEAAYQVIRGAAISFAKDDRVLYKDMDKIVTMLHSGEIVQAVEKRLGKPLKGLAELEVKSE